MNLIDLPEDVLKRVVEYLQWETAVCSRLVCRNLWEIVESSDVIKCCLQVNRRFGSSVRLLIGEDNSYYDVEHATTIELDEIIHHTVPLWKLRDRESGLAFWASQVKEIGFLSALLDEFQDDPEEEDLCSEAKLLANVLVEALYWQPTKFRVKFQDLLPAQWDSSRIIIDTINDSKLDFEVCDVNIAFPVQDSGASQLLQNPIVIGKNFQSLCLLLSNADAEFALHRMIRLLDGVNHKLQHVKMAGLFRRRAVWDLGEVASLFNQRKSIQKLSFSRLKFEVTTNTDLRNWATLNVDNIVFEDCDFSVSTSSHYPAATCNASELLVENQDESIFRIFEFPQLRELKLINDSTYGSIATTSRFLELYVRQLTSLSLFYETWQGCDVFLTPSLFINSQLKFLAFSVDSPDLNKLSFLKNLQNLESLTMLIGPGTTMGSNQAQAFVTELSRSCPCLHSLTCHGLGATKDTFEPEDLNQMRA